MTRLQASCTARSTARAPTLGGSCFVGLVAACLGLNASNVWASQPAFDTAGDSAYNAGWTQGSNGGFGWGGGWQIGAVQNAFIGSSATNGRGDLNGDGDINSPRGTGGRAWGAGFSYDAIRAFSGPLSVGQTFSIDFDDDGFVPRFNDYTGLAVISPAGTVAIAINAAPNYDLRYLGTSGYVPIDTGVRDTDGGIHLAFTKAEFGFVVSITPCVAGATTSAFPVPYYGDIAFFELDTYNYWGTFSPYSTYINNMAITPEPSGGALVVVISLPALRRRRAL